MAERVGFEPTVSYPTPVFKTGALNQALPPLRGAKISDQGRFCKRQRKEKSRRHFDLSKRKNPLCCRAGFKVDCLTVRGA